jgi:signal transduction histidine kinase
MSGSLSQFINPERFRHFYERFHPLPVVSIAVALDGIPSVVVDNQKGIRDALLHLIQTHGLRHIAFIRGPEANPEADLRYHTYTDVLAEQGIPFNADLVTPGNFLYPTGTEAILILLDQRKVQFDAVVSANDEMALGALDILKERHMQVPNAVKVVGFDDIEEARATAPPLTTVRQPLYEQGKRAAEILLAILKGEEVPERVVLPTQLVVRRSCGCLTLPTSRAGMLPELWSEEALPFSPSTSRFQTLSLVKKAAGNTAISLDQGWPERLLDALISSSTDHQKSAFLTILEEIVLQVGISGKDINPWHHVLSILHGYAQVALTDHEASGENGDIWHEAQIIVWAIAQWSQSYRRMLAERHAFEFANSISEPLMTAFDFAGLTEVIDRQLSPMGIRSCYLSLYDQPAGGKQETPTEWSRLIFAHNENGRIELESGGKRFLSRHLTPEGILPCQRRYAILLEPLHFRDETQLGFVLFEPLHSELATLREALSRQISTALKGALLLQERKKTDETLRAYSERLEEMVEERTRELHETQQRLVRQEKLAALGQLAGGVGHELRNPLGVISNAVYFLLMTLPETDKTTSEYLGILSTEVRNAEKIISDLLDFSHSRLPERTATNVPELLNQVIRKRPTPTQVITTIQVEPDLPPLFVDPQQIDQVLTNLVTNAYQAMPEGGNLTIRGWAEMGRVTLSITDTGCGIPPENIKKIFEPLFTTKPRGIGLGLAICKSLVEANGGKIEVISEVAKGSSFLVAFPSQEGITT